MVAVLAFLLWRSARLESQLQETEIERTLLLGERILQRAAESATAFAVVPRANRFEVRDDRIVVDAAVAWLHPIAGAQVIQSAAQATRSPPRGAMLSRGDSLSRLPGWRILSRAGPS